MLTFILFGFTIIVVKQIIEPAKKEESVYFTDFKGHCCGMFDPPVELKISFNYGSKYDGDTLTLHLNDKEIEPVLQLIKQNMSAEYKNQLIKKLDCHENNYEQAIGSRDWSECDNIANSLTLLQYMLDFKYDTE
jgi:hypothetical protein